MCFKLRSHMSAAPPRVGLTQALGGEKRSVAVLSATAIHRLRLAVLFGKIAGALPLRPSSQGALTVCMRYVRWLRCLCVLSCGLSVSDAVTSDTSGCRFSGRAQASGLRPFGKCANASPSPASFPPNKSFKPTPCRGFVETSGHAGNTGRHPPRSARLNSGVSRHMQLPGGVE